MEPRSICELPDKRPVALERKLRFRRNICFLVGAVLIVALLCFFFVGRK